MALGEPEVGQSSSNVGAAHHSCPFPRGSVSISPFYTSKLDHEFKYQLSYFPFSIKPFFLFETT